MMNSAIQHSADILQMVTFRMDGEEFGIDIMNVKEIIRMMEVTKVPNAPEFVDGVINLRGSVVPVIDLRKRFGMPGKEKDKNTRINVVELDGAVVGFVVDSVSEVMRIPSDTVEPPPAVVAGVQSEYISGVGKLDDRLLILLDLHKLLSPEERAALREC
jgi:purine-binding chemotaxis protein CheW